MSQPQPATGDRLDRRVRHRVSVDCAAELVLLSARVAGRLVDLTPAGARMSLAEPVLVPAMGMLRWDGNEAYCSVIWANERQCGIVFERALAPEIVAGTIAAHGETSVAVVAEVGQIAFGARRGGLAG